MRVHSHAVQTPAAHHNIALGITRVDAVAPGTPGHPVPPAAGIDRIGTAAGCDQVVACAAQESVGRPIAGQAVVPVLALEDAAAARGCAQLVIAATAYCVHTVASAEKVRGGTDLVRTFRARYDHERTEPPDCDIDVSIVGGARVPVETGLGAARAPPKFISARRTNDNSLNQAAPELGLDLRTTRATPSLGIPSPPKCLTSAAT